FRLGACSVKFARSVVELAPNCWKAPVGNEPDGSVVANTCWENGVTAGMVRENSYGSGSTSNIPKPARRIVLPLATGLQVRPTRGSKLCRVGFKKNGEPKRGCASVKWSRFDSLLCASVGTVLIS